MSAQLEYYWQDAQAAITSTQSALQTGDTLSLEYRAYYMLEKMFRLLANLNGSIYSGFAMFTAELKWLEIMPENFEQLADQIVRGQLYAATDLRRRLVSVTDGFVTIMERNES